METYTQEGPSHKPTFHYQCQHADGTTSYGVGSTKKKAKSSATKEIVKIGATDTDTFVFKRSDILFHNNKTTVLGTDKTVFVVDVESCPYFESKYKSLGTIFYFCRSCTSATLDAIEGPRVAMFSIPGDRFDRAVYLTEGSEKDLIDHYITAHISIILHYCYNQGMDEIIFVSNDKAFCAISKIYLDLASKYNFVLKVSIHKY